MTNAILGLVLISAGIACAVYLVVGAVRLGLDFRRERKDRREAAEMLRAYQKAHPDLADQPCGGPFAYWMSHDGRVNRIREHGCQPIGRPLERPESPKEPD